MRDALCCVGGDATDEEEEKTLLDWNGIKIVETDCMLPVDRVKPYARNAKRHPQEQIDEIKASIKRFGMDDPIGIWGHGKRFGASAKKRFCAGEEIIWRIPAPSSIHHQPADRRNPQAAKEVT